MNLLQPQDRRSANPGDSREAVAARRRTLARGLGDAVLEAVLRLVHEPAEVLDLGCGEGFFLGRLAAERPVVGYGLDLSAPAVDAAARTWPDQRWVVANADRTLPFSDGAFDLVLSITARKNGPETRRVLRPGGRAVVVVAAEDDLAELREILHGRATDKDRSGRTVEAFAGDLVLVGSEVVRTRATLDREGLEDVLAGTYRGARHRERERLAAVDSLTVTSSHHVLVFAPG